MNHKLHILLITVVSIVLISCNSSIKNSKQGEFGSNLVFKLILLGSFPFLKL